MSELKSWFEKNSTLVGLLGAQTVGIVAAVLSITAYMVKLEVRVHTMETRGAEYTVARMEEMKLKINTLEQKIDTNTASVNRIVSIMTGGLGPTAPRP